MIYETVDTDAPLQQGDIFRAVPRPEFSLGNLAILAQDGSTEQVSWKELVEHKEVESVSFVLAMKPVVAIVISQNCDNARGHDISLCAVESLASHFKDDLSTKISSRNNQILKHAHNPRYFYLPACSKVGIVERSSADFRGVIRLNREDLLDMRTNYRIGRLNDVASEHFRESLAQFFRRYPVNEWYLLTKDEVEVYAKANSLAPEDLYEWQR